MKRPRRPTPRRATAWLLMVLNPVIARLEAETWTDVDARRRILPGFREFIGASASTHIARDLFMAHPEIERLLEKHDEELTANHRPLIRKLEKIQGEIADFHGIAPGPVPKPGPCPTCGRSG